MSSEANVLEQVMVSTQGVPLSQLGWVVDHRDVLLLLPPMPRRHLAGEATGRLRMMDSQGGESGGQSVSHGEAPLQTVAAAARRALRVISLRCSEFGSSMPKVNCIVK